MRRHLASPADTLAKLLRSARFMCLGVVLLLALCSAAIQAKSPDSRFWDRNSKPSPSGTAGAADFPPALHLQPLSEIRENAWASGSEARLAIAGGRLFIPLGAGGLAIYDISSSQAPRLVSRLDVEALHGQAGAVAASANRAFVSIPTRQTIAILDLSPDSQPTVVGTFGDIPAIIGLELRRDTLYVHVQSDTTHPGGVYVFDVSSSEPVLLGSYLQQLIDPGFYVSDDGVIFLARTPGMENDFPKIDVVDMREPARPRLLGQWVSDYPGNITDIDLAGGYLFAAAYWGGIWMLDAANPANMQLVARYDWAQPGPTALSLRALPPYVVLAQNGPDSSTQQFGMLRQIADQFVPEQVLVTDSLPSRVYLEGQLLILEGWQAQTKVLHVYHAITGYMSYLPLIAKNSEAMGH
jgi:hypothetical protein